VSCGESNARNLVTLCQISVEKTTKKCFAKMVDAPGYTFSLNQNNDIFVGFYVKDWLNKTANLFCRNEQRKKTFMVATKFRKS
jgi:hypothetical protein